MTDNKFDNTTLTAAAGTAQTINIKNNGAAVHNLHISGADGKFATDFCTTTGADPCSNPNRVGGGATATLTFTLPAGTYQYRCDYHPADMKGTLTVQ
jgi:plastocyanin